MSRRGPQENPKSRFTPEEHRAKHLARAKRNMKRTIERKRQRRIERRAELEYLASQKEKI